MKYEIPTLRAVASAVSLVHNQGSGNKPSGNCCDGGPHNGSSAGAYELDE